MGVLFCPLKNFLLPTPEKKDLVVPFSSDFSVTLAQEISEWLSSFCMTTVCMSSLADLPSTSCWLSVPHHSIPGVWHVTAESSGASHVGGMLLRPGMLRGLACVCGSHGVTRGRCDLCSDGNKSGKEWPESFPYPKVRVNFEGTSRVRTLAPPHDPSEALAGLCRGPRPEKTLQSQTALLHKKQLEILT